MSIIGLQMIIIYIKLIPCGNFIIEFNEVLPLEFNIGNTWCTKNIQCRIYDVCE